MRLSRESWIIFAIGTLDLLTTLLWVSRSGAEEARPLQIPGAELPGGAQSEFARTTGGQTGGVTAAPSFGNPATGAGGAQGGAVGSAGEDNEYGARASEDERAEEEERSS